MRRAGFPYSVLYGGRHMASRFKESFELFTGKRGRILLLVYIAIGFAHPAMVSLVFMQYVYYDPMLAAMGINNMQLGLLLTIEGAGAVVLALPVGVMVDRFDCNKILYASFLASALACAAFALFPAYSVALGVWGVLSVTMCGFIPGVYKMVRIIVPEEYEGRSYGVYGFFNAIGFMLINFFGLALYSHVEKTLGMEAGLSAILWTFCIILAIASTVAFFGIRSIGTCEKDDATLDRVTLKEVKRVAMMPGTWLVFIIAFSINSLHITVSYFTPYFTSVLGVAAVFSGAFAVIRQYGVRLLVAPVGGWLGDRMRSNTTVIVAGFALASVFILVVLFLPPSVPLVVAILVVLAIAVFDNLLMPFQYSACREAMIPPKYMGTVIGLTTILIPDLFVPSMFGSWLDTFGNGGYAYIFLFSIGLNALAIAAGVIIIRRYRKRQLATKES